MKDRPLLDYWNCVPIPSERFNSDLPGFSDVVYPEFKKGITTAQYDLQGELWWRRGERLIPDKAVRLQRPTQDEIRLRNGRNRVV